MHGCLNVVKTLIAFKKKYQQPTQYSVEDVAKFESISVMMVAAIYGHADVVEYLLKEGADINTTKSSGDTALMVACARGHERVIHVLLDRNADVSITNNFGMNALVASIVNKSITGVRTLLKYYQEGKIELHLNLPYRGECPLSVCLSHLTAGESVTNTTIKEIAKNLIFAGANKEVVDKKGLYTPLMVASATGHIDLLLAMLEGVEVLPEEVMMKASKSAKVRNHSHIRRHQAEVVFKANVQALTRLGSALNVSHSAEVTEVLLRHGANVNSKNFVSRHQSSRLLFKHQ